MEKGDGKERDECEHEDEGYDIWRSGDDRNGEWEISVRVLWKRGGRKFIVVLRGHPRCSGLRYMHIAGVDSSVMCEGGRQEMSVRQVRMGETLVEVMDGFCYLGDAMRCEGGAEAAVRVRIACAWKSWRELASLLANHNIPLGSRALVYRACVRSLFL